MAVDVVGIDLRSEKNVNSVIIIEDAQNPFDLLFVLAVPNSKRLLSCDRGPLLNAQPLTMVPPLQWIVCPLIHELSDEARNTTQVAISLGCAGRPIGAVNCFCCLVPIVELISGVQTGPGAIVLTRMPLLSCWLLRPRVKEMIAPLVDV